MLAVSFQLQSAGFESAEFENTEHPRLISSSEDIAQIRQQLSQAPLFEADYLKQKAAFDLALETEIDVPVPKDAGGGYTHEQHKRNYKAINTAGFLYQITGDRVYAERGRDLLMAYADLYPTLGLHPMKKEQSAGKLFWQSLNEAVWLLYSIQGYDFLYDALSADERSHIENDLFRNVATYLSDESPQTFDKVHNHGTWAAAAVGMTGYVLDDPDMVEKALYGLDKSGNSGFFKQIDMLFSPQGYYTEGPYYQRYALMPFILFAKSIDNNEPERKIFEYRDQLLLKAVYGAIQLSYGQFFFPINDALKDKGLDTVELVHAVAIAYGITADPTLLSIAREQGQIDLSGDGLALAKGLQENMDQPFAFTSMLFGDGADGSQGALAILRSEGGAQGDEGHQALVLKNTSQGMGHGHFDKLSWLYYDNGNEIVTDYGAARFLNIEAKYGGHYLPENDSWAQETIAHNTLVVDGKSHFDTDLSKAELVAPTQHLFDVAEGIQKGIQISSASMEGAYPDTDFTRTMALLSDDSLDHSLVIDVLRVESEKAHQYDLPLHYQGHIIEVNFPYTASTKKLEALGRNHGYQHLWVKARGRADAELAQITWLKDDRFYTNSVLATKNQEFIFTELGANDPDFNLRPDPAVIQRVNKARDHTFVSILETHGEYNPVQEYTTDSHTQIAAMSLHSNGDIDLIQFETTAGDNWSLAIAYDQNAQAEHRIEVKGIGFEWQGRYKLFRGQ